MRLLLAMSCLVAFFASQSALALQANKFNTFSSCYIAQADEQPTDTSGEKKPKKEGEEEPDCE